MSPKSLRASSPPRPSSKKISKKERGSRLSLFLFRWSYVYVPGSGLRCPIKSSGLRFPLILSTAAQPVAPLHLPQAAGHYGARIEPTSLISRLPAPIKKETPKGASFFIGAGNRNRTGTDFTPRDFKSLVSTCSTIPAAWLSYHSLPLPSRENSQSWSRFRLKGVRHSRMNQSSSGIFIFFIASIDSWAAESNSVLPAFCSSMHLM